MSKIAPATAKSLLGECGPSLDELDEMGHRARTKALTAALRECEASQRQEIEAIAKTITGLTGDAQMAERALRNCCRREDSLIALLDQDASLEDRALSVKRADEKRFQRAVNVAMGYRLSDGRYHHSYMIPESGALRENLSDAADEVRNVLEDVASGRRVAADVFTYQDDADNEPVHHVAFFVEAPASLWIGFKDNDELETFVQRDSIEVAVSYRPDRDQINISGKRLKGAPVFEQIAKVFQEHALSDNAPEELNRQDWNLERFCSTKVPAINWPSGFANCRVRAITFQNRDDAGQRVKFDGGIDGDAYTRISNFGLTGSMLAKEFVRSVELRLERPADEEQPSRLGSMILSFPNGRRFVGGLSAYREELDDWANKELTK